jgi:hypothetical protein
MGSRKNASAMSVQILPLYLACLQMWPFNSKTKLMSNNFIYLATSLFCLHGSRRERQFDRLVPQEEGCPPLNRITTEDQAINKSCVVLILSCLLCCVV